MKKQGALSLERKKFIQDLIIFYKPQNLCDIREILKEILTDILQCILEFEMDQHLGYSKYDYQNKTTENSRNGYSKKTVFSSLGDICLSIPRDRKGEFCPQIVRKYQTDITDMEHHILSMYAKGMSTRDIAMHLKSVCSHSSCAETISRITNRILPLAKAWQNRPLSSKYIIVFMDALRFYVRTCKGVTRKSVYIAIGILENGKKELLGIWIYERESISFWQKILYTLKERGVQNIQLIVTDGHNDLHEIIPLIFPEAAIQRCIVHQIRNTTKFINHKDIRSFAQDLKRIYQAPSLSLAEKELDHLEENWIRRYPDSVICWKRNWPQLSTYFHYPLEVRKLIYSTNLIESFHRQLRKITHSKTIFPSEDALFKLLYLISQELTEKWIPLHPKQLSLLL